MTGRTRILRSAAFAVLLVGLLASCENVDVTAVDVATVEVVPDAATLFIGQSRRLVVHVMADDRTVIDRPVAWMSSDADRVSIDEAGRITAHRAGTVRITARSEGVTGTALIDVPGLFNSPRSSR
jgi:uncharacterized protein YjdB